MSLFPGFTAGFGEKGPGSYDSPGGTGILVSVVPQGRMGLRGREGRRRSGENLLLLRPLLRPAFWGIVF